MARIFVDTSALYALIDRDDGRHAGALRRFDQLKRSKTEPIISNFVVAETHALLLARLGSDLARRWLIGNVWHVERVSQDDEAKALEIIGSYTDKTFSYTDATSFALMERLRLRRALAFDRHFQQYGFQID